MLRLAAGLLAVGGIGLQAQARGMEDYEQAPIRYSTTQPHDAIVKLDQQLRSGGLTLPAEDRAQMLTLLRELNIPVESQVLVFSKTSFQRERISPSTPRAIFFNDECYLAWVPGGLFEAASIDPELGPVFYTFNPHEKPVGDKARFARDEDCLRCHGGQFVRDVPAVFVRSLHADDSGDPLLKFGSQVVDHRTPFSERWGGWYVTGRHGQTPHRGNVFAREDKGELVVDYRNGANVTNLAQYCDLRPHLAQTSDIVALLVMEHQLATQNALTRASYSARRMLDYQRNIQRDLKEPVTDEPTYDSVKRVFDNSAQDVVDHLLFKDEAALPEGGVQGSSGFQQTFTTRARKTKSGASLREFDLQRHIFRNRCSYLIDSPQFQALLPQLKSRIYSRLARALHATQPDPRYAYLEADERARIITVLKETHQELPPNW